MNLCMVAHLWSMNIFGYDKLWGPSQRVVTLFEGKEANVIIFIFNNAHDDFQGSCDSEEVSELRGAKQLQLGG